MWGRIGGTWVVRELIVPFRRMWGRIGGAWVVRELIVLFRRIWCIIGLINFVLSHPLGISVYVHLLLKT